MGLAHACGVCDGQNWKGLFLALAIVFAGAVAVFVRGSSGGEARAEVSLTAVPEVVYRVPHSRYGNLEGWFFNVVVDDGDPADSLLAIQADVELLLAGNAIRSTHYGAEVLP
ncbi:MAG: hypothetical protein ABFS34_06230 [Gemmatimonadota bacterium]